MSFFLFLSLVGITPESRYVFFLEKIQIKTEINIRFENYNMVDNGTYLGIYFKFFPKKVKKKYIRMFRYYFFCFLIFKNH